MLTREPQAFGSSAEEHNQTTVEATAARIASAAPEDFILGAFRDGALGGVAGFHSERELKSRHKGRVWGVYVIDPWRGRGVGRALMAGLIERAKGQPELRQIILAVAVPQTAARRLYESLGFVAFGREPRALIVDDLPIDEDYYLLMLD